MKRSPEANAAALEEFRRRDSFEKLASLRTILGTPGRPYCKIALSFMCHAVEKDPYSAMEIVHLERWGKVTSLFGPVSFQDPRLFLDKIRSVLRQRWFHGNLSREGACDALKGMKQGTFLVRMSTNPLHSAVISVNMGRNVNHIQIEFLPERGFRLLGKTQFFPSLTALVEGYVLQGPLKGAAAVVAHPLRPP